MSTAARRITAAALAVLWVAALTQNVATTHHLNADQTFSGIGILFLGIIGPLDVMFSWYANPLLLLGLILSLQPPPRSAWPFVVLSILIVLLVANAALWHRIPDDSGDNPIIRYHAGYWLWMTTMVLAAAWFAVQGFGKRPTTPVSGGGATG